ncbi:MAG: hypothetical protein KGL68_04300 [Burkholderiales bacterium]|nr:hypothetical protein [Burkholderiales bacterium]
MSNFFFRFTALLTLLALAACGGGSQDPASPGDGGGTWPPPVTTPASPPAGGSNNGSLEPLAGAAEPFPATGSPMAATPTVSGVSADHRYLLSWDPTSSSQYTFGFLHRNGAETRLYVPVGSFLDEVGITTADVTSIGPAVTSVIAAIDIEPGDYLTEKTLTANFMIPDSMMASIDPAQLIGFAADGDGSNLHLVPIVVGDLGTSVKRPAIKLDHLGIVGIALATSEQQAALAAALPADQGDRLTAILAPTLTANWRNAVAPASALPGVRTAQAAAAVSTESFATAALRGYYNDVVVPAFAAADADPTQIPAATQAGFNFLRQAALSGESAEGGTFQVVASQVYARILALTDVYADYIASQCSSLGGPQQLQQMLGTMRSLQLLGHQSKSDELQAILPQCSRFKITFHYEFTANGHWTEGGGADAMEEDLHAVVDGTQTLEPLTEVTYPSLQLTTLDWTRKRTNSQFGITRYTWAKDDVTPPWSINGFSVPVVRTRGGTAPVAVTMYLSPFVDVGANNSSSYHPFTASGSSVFTSTEGVVSAPVPMYFDVMQLPIFVSTLVGDGQNNFGRMLVSPSGSASSSATRVVPLSGGTRNESETVTLTVGRPQ